MGKLPYRVFRFYDSEGNCLYVGRTGKPVGRVTRVYQLQRSWGSEIDVSLTVDKGHATPTAADNTLSRWLRKYLPIYRAAPPTTRNTTVPQLSLLERVAAIHKRNREMRQNGL